MLPMASSTLGNNLRCLGLRLRTTGELTALPQTLLAIKDVGIFHFQAAVKCAKRCVKSRKIAHERPPNHFQLRLHHRPHWGAYDALPDLLVGWGGRRGDYFHSHIFHPFRIMSYISSPAFSSPVFSCCFVPIFQLPHI